ncbi:MAG: nicotinate-nucleotide adenylyltransferase [Methylocystaceae bacterium]
MKLGVMGGTFDPIHLGHLAAAENARFYLELDRVLFMLSAQPPHKLDMQVTSAHHRLKMVELAVADNPHFEVSTLEMQRKGASYTVDTIKQLHVQFAQPEIYFLMGSDSLFDLVNWYHYEEIAHQCLLVSISRPGFANEDAYQSLPLAVRASTRILEVPKLEISSTELKRRLKSGEPVRYLLPTSVEAYIKEHHLYEE